jgi:zinc transport system ATP-binding protein
MVLDRASFHIHQGEFVALVGPNGSGKTTVLKLLLGLEKPQRGKIKIFGSPSSPALSGRIGYVPQQALTDRAFPISVEEVVRMGRLRPLSRKRGGEDRDAVREALDQSELTELAGRPYRALSGGQRRRVLVARALAARPDILILDEPTANMDAESEEGLYKTLGRLKGNTTILIVTHDTGFVSPLTGRVLCMGNRGGEGRAHSIVQHPLEASGSPHGGGDSRILHSESIPADICCNKKGKAE